MDGSDASGDFPDEAAYRRVAHTEGVSYKPKRRVHDEHVFSKVHRTQALVSIDRRAKKFESVRAFALAHEREYEALSEPRLVQRPARPRDQGGLLRDKDRYDSALRTQRALRERRNQLEQEPDAQEAEGGGHLGPFGDEDPGLAGFLPEAHLAISPAEYARELIAKRLPAPRADGDGFQVPRD